MKKTDYFNGFTLFVAAICLLTLILNMVNNRFLLADFIVYYSAAANYITGSPVYLVSFFSGSGYYKYTPAILFFFMPYTLLPYKVAATIHFLVLGTAYGYAMLLLSRLVTRYLLGNRVKYELWLLALSFGCIMMHVNRELYLGNINIILLMLSCLALRDMLTARDLRGGILLGLVVLAKPYLLLLVIPLVFRRRWRALAWLCITGAVGLLLPFLFSGPQKSVHLYREWINSVLTHGGEYPGKTSIDYFLHNLFPSWPGWGAILIFSLFLLLITGFIVRNIRLEKQEGVTAGMAGRDFTFEWFLILALLPNLIRTDWVLMMFASPVIIFMIFYISSQRLYRVIPVLVVLLLVYGANSDDLLGKSLSHTIMESGLMGVSNFLLAMVALYLFFHNRKATPGAA
ncbi:MAG: glycosyltransferase family 87 protein [Bacteroidota bacterium]